MKYFAIVALLLSVGCASSIKLPGTKDPHTEQIQALVKAIEKQSDAIVAIATKASPTPTPTPEEIKPIEFYPEKEVSHVGEEPISLIAKGVK